MDVRAQTRYVWIAGLIMAAAGAFIMFGWIIFLKPQVALTSGNIGSLEGGQKFIISGKNFLPVGTTRVLVGAAAATRVHVISGTSIEAQTPPGAEGATSVTVISPNGQRATLTAGYTYSRLQLKIEGILPSEVPAAGGVMVTITGSGFIAGPVDVYCEGKIVPATVVDDTSLTFIAPPAPVTSPTRAHLVVRTKDGTWSSDAYTLIYH